MTRELWLIVISTVAALTTGIGSGVTLAIMVGKYLLRHEMNRILEVVDRIPPREWFVKVAAVLESYPLYAASVADHGGRIGRVEELARETHEDLGLLRREHETLTRGERCPSHKDKGEL